MALKVRLVAREWGHFQDFQKIVLKKVKKFKKFKKLGLGVSG
jgi:hypothetical protein